MNYHTITWLELHSSCFALSQKIIKNPQNKYDVIVAISRGGLAISHIFSDFLELPVVTIATSSYKNMQKQESAKLTGDIAVDIANKSILLIDEVSDTGNTFKLAVSYLQQRGASKIKTCSLHIKPHTTFIPDFYQTSIDAWIIYPTEMRETISTLTQKWKSENIGSVTIKRRLQKLAIPTVFINYFTT